MDFCLSGLETSRLIINEIGHRVFDSESVRLFFDLIDRRYSKEGNYIIIFTGNKDPALRREDFIEDATLLCALHRIFDDTTVFKLRCESSVERSSKEFCFKPERLKLLNR